MEFDWDDANRGHIAEHGVGTEEAEQVVLNGPIDVDVQIRSGEERTLQIGETDAGRILVVITTWREQKVRIVTAFPAKKKMRQFYEREKENQGAGDKDS